MFNFNRFPLILHTGISNDKKSAYRLNHLIGTPFQELLLVFAVFYLYGSWPIPDSNEPYYIGKAIHFWQSDWIPNDTFLESRDSHSVFFACFGWLSFFFSPAAMAVIGRWMTWFLLAWSWQRLSFALLPIRWASVLTATALAYYVDSFHMAGEWIIGGIEGKSFAFPLVFFGLEAAVRGRWNRVWIFLGGATAFHVLVGGWSALVVGFVYLSTPQGEAVKRSAPQGEVVKRSVPQGKAAKWGLFLGGLLALPGLIPALLLDRGASWAVVSEAHQIYVFERLYHHLVPSMLPWTYSARFVLLAALWFFVCRSGPLGNRRHRRFDAFVFGTLVLWLIGFAADWFFRDNRVIAAEILRFYWFRLADVAVPMGVAVGGWRRFLALASPPLVFPITSPLWGGLGWGLPKIEKAPHPSPLPEGEGTIIQTLRLAGFCFAVAFGLYLLFDHLVFGCWFFSWTLSPERGIPWILTLLTGFALLTFSRYSGAAFYAIGLILLYGAILLYAPLETLASLGDLRTRFAYSRIESGPPKAADDWIAVCGWIRENTPKTSKFWVPREAATFQWHARRSDVGVWKNIPQDAEGIVEWYRTMQNLFSYKEDGTACWNRSLTILLWWKTNEEIDRLRTEYGFEYIVCGIEPELSHLPILQRVYPTAEHPNEYYAVYRICWNLVDAQGK